MLRPFPALLVLFLTMAPASAQEAVDVRISLLKDIALHPLRSAPASVVSLNSTTMSAEIFARVLEITVKVGDIAEKGTVLVRLDCTNYELAVKQTSAALKALQVRAELADKRLERTRVLRQNDSVSLEALDERYVELAVMQAEIDAAEASLDRARSDRESCSVISPYKAVILSRIGATGEYAAPGSPLLELVDIEDIEVSAHVSTEEISLFQDTSELYFSYADKKYPIVPRAILPVINPETRAQEVRLLFSDKKAMVGASGKVFWIDVRPYVPANLLVERNGSLGIFSEKNGVAVFHGIPTAQPGRSAPVNLPGDTRIVVDGHYSLRDKVAVRVSE